MKFKVMFNFML